MIWDVFEIPGFDVSNTLIIDDLPEVYKIQPCNCINIKEFEFDHLDSENDKELLKIIDKLKNLLEKKIKKDVCLVKAF